MAADDTTAPSNEYRYTSSNGGLSVYRNGTKLPIAGTPSGGQWTYVVPAGEVVCPGPLEWKDSGGNVLWCVEIAPC